MDVCPLEDGNYGSELPNITNALPQSNLSQGQHQHTPQRIQHALLEQNSAKVTKCLSFCRFSGQAKEDGVQPGSGGL